MRPTAAASRDEAHIGRDFVNEALSSGKHARTDAQSVRLALEARIDSIALVRSAQAVAVRVQDERARLETQPPAARARCASPGDVFAERDVGERD